jgi:hypothetical protein
LRQWTDLQLACPGIYNACHPPSSLYLLPSHTLRNISAIKSIMFTQTHKKSSSSIPTFKQALNKPSSIPKRGVRASSNKENIAPYVYYHTCASVWLTSFRSSAMPAPAKRSSATRESQVKHVADVAQKKSSCYRVTVSRSVISIDG